MKHLTMSIWKHVPDKGINLLKEASRAPEAKRKKKTVTDKQQKSRQDCDAHPHYKHLLPKWNMTVFHFKHFSFLLP